MTDIPKQLRDEIAQFFATCEELDPNRHSQLHGWHGRAVAEASIREARERLRTTPDDQGSQRG